MKTIAMSVDCAEWTRYYYEIEVDDTKTAEEQREEALEKYNEGDYRDLGTKCLGNVEMIDAQFNFPEELGG